MGSTVIYLGGCLGDVAHIVQVDGAYDQLRGWLWLVESRYLESGELTARIWEVGTALVVDLGRIDLEIVVIFHDSEVDDEGIDGEDVLRVGAGQLLYLDVPLQIGVLYFYQYNWIRVVPTHKCCGPLLPWLSNKVRILLL